MLIAVLIVGAAASPIAAQPPGSPETRNFVQAAGEADTFEIMEAQSALAESKDPQVLAFARTMISDHRETSRKLAAATVQSGLTPPPMAVGAAQSPLLAALQSLRDAAFDRAYWRHQALAHRAALTTEQGYAATGDTPAIRAVAAGTIPVIQAHLAMAEQMSAQAEAEAGSN